MKAPARNAIKLDHATTLVIEPFQDQVFISFNVSGITLARKSSDARTAHLVASALTMAADRATHYEVTGE